MPTARRTRPLPRRRGLTRATATFAIAVTVALVATLAGCSSSSDDRGTARTTTTPTEPTVAVGRTAEGWTRLPDWPLSKRTDATTAWTGKEMLFIGGFTDRCPPNADCTSMLATAKADGAALDPKTGTWRAIATAPMPIVFANVKVAGGRLYLLQPATRSAAGSSGPGQRSSAFLSYDPGADRWKRLALPAKQPDAYTLVAVGDDVVASSGSDEGGSLPVRLFDAATGRWHDLPDDPLPRLFDRTMVAHGGDLYLFGKELVAQPGSAKPSLVLGARLDLATETWSRLPDSGSIGYGVWDAGDGTLVNPALGGADGGEVNNWGRWYPEGSIFDTRTDTWSDLPAPPGDREQASGFGMVAGTHSVYGQSGSLVLDLTSGTWTRLPRYPGSLDVDRRIATAGADAIAFGGVDRSGGGPARVLSEVWIWHPPT